MEKKTIGKFIAVLRKANGMTQKELADKLLVSDKTVSRWERDENTPDLYLIPVIADIFGITSDELLRGEKDTSKSMESVESKSTVKSDKQFKFLLHKQYKEYKTKSMVSLLLLALGLIFATISNEVFTSGLLGFLLGLLCIVVVIFFQHLIKEDQLILIDEEEVDYRIEEIRKVNTKITLIELYVIFITLAVFAFLLPLGIYSVAYTGLETGVWFLFGTMYALNALFVSYIVYSFYIKKKLYTREDLYFTQEEIHKDQYSNSIFIKTCKIFGSILMITFAINMGIYNFSLPLFKEYQEFDTYHEFKSYMESLVIEEYFGTKQEVTDEWLRILYEDMSVTIVEDGKGNAVTSYLDDPSVYEEIIFSFDTSEDGLPIRVLSTNALMQAYTMRNTFTLFGWILCGVEVVGAIIYYILNMRKYK
ncbi:MAG: helix-turn-helix transcriptional regulator [Erysipelotrichales bacterium]|nr:helix-turn-helix transcriptional regulator [Erysipelotrichales bacterium]